MAKPKVKFIFKEEHILHIIEKVQMAAYIWDLKNLSYKNTPKKQIFWTQLFEDLNTSFPNDGPFIYSNVVRKWNNLKTYFSTEYQKYHTTCKSGTASDNVDKLRESSWTFFEKLIFLKETCEIMPSINNYNRRSLSELSGDSSLEESRRSDIWEYDCEWPVEYLETIDNNNATFGLTNSSPKEIMTEASPVNQPTSYYIQSTSSYKSAFNKPSTSTNNKTVSISLTSTPEIPSRESNRSKTSTPYSSSSESQTRVERPRPLHPTKKTRVSLKSKEEQLADACMDSSKEIKEMMKSHSQLKHRRFGDYIAQELEDFDEELVALAKNKINNVIYEISKLQLQKRS